MPPAAAAVGGWGPLASLGLGGVSILDNIFGSGADSRDMQQQGLDMQQRLGEAQLPDIQRRSELNQFLEDLLKDKMANPQGPEQFLDLDPVVQQFYPDMNLIPQSVYQANSPGIMSRQALDQLMQLGGNVGTGGVHGFSNQAVGIGEDRRDEFKQNINSIVRALLMSGALNRQGANDPSSMPSRAMFGTLPFSSPPALQPQSVGGPPPGTL